MINQAAEVKLIIFLFEKNWKKCDIGRKGLSKSILRLIGKGCLSKNWVKMCFKIQDLKEIVITQANNSTV